MLKEGDRQGLWRIMESSLRYDTRAFDITMCRIFLHIIFVSLSLVLEHLPWLMPYFRLLTKAKLRKSPLADHSQRRIDQRLKEGPTSRDLFYYLVRPIPILMHFSNTQSRSLKEQWRWCRPTAAAQNPTSVWRCPRDYCRLRYDRERALQRFLPVDA